MPYGTIIGAAAGVINNVVNSGTKYGATSPYNIVQLSPEQQQFFELQALDAERSATAQEAASTEQANNSYTASNWVKFAAIGVAIYLFYKIFAKKGYFD